uniref:F-box domain-containing protein n=1 Tax=Oryza glumipatula TaxID=40148 RepID=A0A0D9ZMB1_9ORYZ
MSRLSDLPDEALLVILNKLDTVLSRRWRRVPGMLPNIELDVDSFTSDHDDGFTSTLSDDARNNYAMVGAVQSLLSHESRHDIRRLDPRAIALGVDLAKTAAGRRARSSSVFLAAAWSTPPPLLGVLCS